MRKLICNVKACSMGVVFFTWFVGLGFAFSVEFNIIGQKAVNFDC